MRTTHLSVGQTATRLAAAVALIAGTVVGLATPAFAHHPVLDATVECVEGEYVITWTITNSETTSGTNRTMHIEILGVSHGTVDGAAVGDTLPPRPLAGSTIHPTTTLPGTTDATVTLTVKGRWPKPGDDVIATRTTSVRLGGDCTNPAQPTAEWSWSCETGLEVWLFNDGGEDADFRIRKNGEPLEKIIVPPGGEVHRTYELEENEVASFRIFSESGTGFDTERFVIDNDCLKPPALSGEIGHECGEGAVVSVTNDGEEPATVWILKNGEVADSFQVAGGDTVTTTYPMAENEVATFQVVTGDPEEGEPVTEAVVVDYDCLSPPLPSAAIAHDCETGVTVTMDNDGQESATFTITKNGDVVDVVEVPGGGQAVRVFQMDEDEVATWAVTSQDGQGVDQSLEVDNDCVQVSPTTVVNTTTTTVAPATTAPAPTTTTAAPTTTTAAPTTTTVAVLGVQVTSPRAQLPRTGTELGDLVRLGLQVVLAGSVLWLVTTDRRRARHEP